MRGRNNDREYLLKDYEQVRSELRNYSKNQFAILSILVTASIAILQFSKVDPSGSDLVFATGFLIPALFAYLGVLWLDQVYRQKELGCYSCMLEAEIAGEDHDMKGWEHYLHMRHRINSRHKVGAESKCPPVDFWRSIIKILLSANYYYYTIFLAGFIGLPILSSKYCSRQIVNLPSGVQYSRLCNLRFAIVIVFLLIAILYIRSIFVVQRRINIIIEESEASSKRSEITPNKEPVNATRSSFPYDNPREEA